MHLPDDATLLDLLEQGQGRGAVARTKLLLASALPATDDAGWAALRVSAADIALLQLRKAMFGGRMLAETSCRYCAEPLEFELDAGPLIDGCTSASGRDAAAQGSAFREPTIADLAAIADIANAEAALRQLASRCWLGRQDGAPSDAEIEQIDALYGQAAILLHLECAACGQAWDEAFDIGAFLWEEIAQRAEARLDEVHVLATAYGWSEPQILALSDARRAAYLRRCGA
jgi:hypothetical protein